MRCFPGRGFRHLVLLVVAAAVSWTGTASAQYFGRNKVQYERFDFRVLSTAHFDIYYYPQEEKAARDAGRMAERWYSRYRRLFDYRLQERKPIILYANHADFEQTNVLSGFLGQGTGGVTESLKNRVVMPLTGDYAGSDHVLGHELVHVFQYDIASAEQDSVVFRLERIPLWVIEGMAEYLSLGRDHAQTSMWLRDALLRDKFPTVRQLATDPRFFPYRFGHALLAFLGGRWGDDKVGTIFRDAGRRGIEYALSSATGVSPDSLSKMWKAAVEEAYGPVLAARTPPDSAGERILAADVDAGDVNLAPVLSPDGTRVAFLSEKDLFSIDLFVADAMTGKVLKKVVSASTNPHFDALRFIDSAGSWSPDGKRLAVVVFAKGDNEILIVDAHSGRIERRIRPEGLGAISNPAWSPDGRTIAFSGSAGGISDLYRLDLASGKVRRLTDDPYAQLTPAWSPDGKTLAFVTDFGPGTDFTNLTFDPMGLGLMDADGGPVRVLRPFPGADHYNPQFSPDGRSLYFISDRDGFSDVYRVFLETGETFQVTRLATGVSGITALSPALTVARESGRVMFSVFSDGKYNVFALTGDRARGTPVVTENPQPCVDFLPPAVPDSASFVQRYLEDPYTGLASGEDFSVTRYKPSIRLDYVGAVAAGAYVDQFGAGLAGAVSAHFSDMLGNHSIGAALAANGGIKDVGGQVFYVNRTHRWNWGAVAGHIPYLSYYTTVRDTTLEGSSGQGFVVEQTRERLFVDSGSLIGTYPFSSTRRVEASVGFTHYGFDREVERQVSVNGYVVEDRITEEPSPEGLSLFQGSLALVGDNSIFGFTSPIQGQRYRVEVDPTFGSLQYQTVVADLRRYLFFRPVTVAGRLVHIGRYGADAESNRLAPLFLGYATLVRGYSSGSFDLSECSTGNAADCPEFDRLIGSRIGVVNLEVRVPLFGTSRFGLVNFPYLPTELSAFVDAGVAWNRGEKPELKFERRSAERIPVVSSGMSARFNVLGALVLEVYYAYPFQRPEKGAHFGFQIAPGW